MMAENDDITLEQFVDLKLSANALMADRVLPDLLAAAENDPNPDMQAAVKVLGDWDRTFSRENRGGILFEEWAKLFAGPRMTGQAGFAVPWSADDPINTPFGIKDPAASVEMLRKAIASTREKYGVIDPVMAALAIWARSMLSHGPSLTKRACARRRMARHGLQ